MKIQLDLYNTCLSKTCPFRKECAQHTSAGDFRSERGFSPQITEALECLTADHPSVETIEGIFPENHESLGYGYKANPFIENSIAQASSETITEDDIRLLRGIAAYLFHLNYTLNKTATHVVNAVQIGEYGIQLDRLVERLTKNI